MKSNPLQVVAINDGSLPEAMQWKRTTVFAVANENDPLLASYLKQVTNKEGQVVTSPTPPPDLTGMAQLYLLLGWSTGGLDELRAAKLDSAVISDREIKVWLWKPSLQPDEGVMGTADMKFVGWKIDPRELAEGNYTVKLYVSRGKVKAGSEMREALGAPELMKELKFHIDRDK
ncbi:MAG: hypothetical protein NTW14_12895 [bacterium]|nr:hypothetical protein [bacterium]